MLYKNPTVENESNCTSVCLSKGCFIGSKINEQCFGNILTSETLYPEGLNSDWHSHESLRYSHILNGGHLEKRKDWEQEHTIGDLLFYHPGTIHKNVNYGKSTRVFNIEIDEKFFEEYQLIQYVTNQASSYQQHQCKIMVFRILQECLIHDIHSASSINQLCLELTQISDTGRQTANFPPWVNVIHEILNDNWNHSFTLYDLSVIIGIHPVTISKKFSKYFSCTLGEYLRRIRIYRSLPMLRNSNHSLTEIAYICGFSDQSHFTKTFRRVTGFLPKEYKKM